MDDQRALNLESRERARHARNFQLSDGLMPMTTGFRNRFRPNERRVLLLNDLGEPVSCSPTQNSVYVLVQAGTGLNTVRSISKSLGVAPSTVSRALTMLASKRLIAYDIVRGRYGGIKRLETTWADMKGRAKAAKAKISRQYQLAEQRWYRKLARTGYYWSGLNVALSTNVGRNIETGALTW
jgi:DNA-binding MarR family transcriptional regulator